METRIATLLPRARRLFLLACGFGVIYLGLRFGVLRIPEGHDAMEPSYLPGMAILYDRRFGELEPGTVVLYHPPERGLHLGVVAGPDRAPPSPPDLVFVVNGNDLSRLPDSRVFGPVPRENVLGMVICEILP